MLPRDVAQLLHEVHLQRTANAAVLQRDQTLVLLPHYSALFNQVGIDVHLADVVHDDGKPNTALIGENPIQQRRFSAAQITREQQNGNFL